MPLSSNLKNLYNKSRLTALFGVLSFLFASTNAERGAYVRKVSSLPGPAYGNYSFNLTPSVGMTQVIGLAFGNDNTS